MSTSERLLLRLTLAAALVLRALAYFRYRFDSDEQQHLHVTWGWTAGKVQYRDLFDNHAPLFHMLTAPILAMLGERPDILLWMRAPMLILFAVVVWATWDLGRRLYDDRVAAWAVALLVLFPPFFLKSLEFRTDNLWNAFWMLALVAIVRGKRPFLAGFLLGCALATSPKTAALLIAIVTAALLLRFFRRETWPPRHAIEAAIGFAIVPVALTVYFASAGALDELVYCVFTFNGSLALLREYLWIGRAIFPFTFAAVIYAAWRMRETPRLRWLLAVVIGVFTVTVAGLWPLISPRDFLPMMPLAAIFAAAVLRSTVPIGVAVAVFLGALFYYADRFENHTDWHVTMMDQALRLTHPGERLIDIKGETIYRERPFYYALEVVTRSQMARGIIPDTIAVDVVRTRTYAAQADGPMWPPAGRAWLSDHFVNLGRLRAAGQWVRQDGAFTIGVPGEYVVLNARGEATGALDGTPYTGARVLAEGAHRFEGEKNVCVVWAPAFRRGHSPFHLRDLDF